MAFKLGNERRGIRNSSYKKSSGAPIFKKKLEEGVMAEANMDGSMYVDSSVDLNSKLGQRVIKHEQCHIDQIKSGKAAYGDEWVMWEDNIYFRKDIEGEKVIDGPNGRWPEGHPNHPWEAEAIAAEKINIKK